MCVTRVFGRCARVGQNSPVRRPNTRRNERWHLDSVAHEQAEREHMSEAGDGDVNLNVK